jgi:dihydrofolate synthase/folylpolyglutamate synthase
LISITERIKVDAEPIPETQFAKLTGTVKAVAEQLVARGELPAPPTFFEHVTAIALLAFAQGEVELAILETGLGGRLDSTTAVEAATVAITPIDMDHQEYLGHTLAEIAAEKAAIVRPGVTAIVARQQPEALNVIVRRCDSVGVQPRLVASVEVSQSATTADGRAIVSFKTGAATYGRVTLALRGLHQIDNAATAISIAEALRENDFQITHEAIVQGLETATHSGRLELWPGAPTFLFDGAHNPAAARALRNYLDHFINQPIVMIFGAMRDKALNEMVRTLFPKAVKVILTTLDNPRAASVDDLMAAIPGEFAKSEIVPSSNVAEALELARKMTKPNGIVCVTGSLHLIGSAQELLAPAFKTTEL